MRAACAHVHRLAHRHVCADICIRLQHAASPAADAIKPDDDGQLPLRPSRSYGTAKSGVCIDMCIGMCVYMCLDMFFTAVERDEDRQVPV